MVNACDIYNQCKKRLTGVKAWKKGQETTPMFYLTAHVSFIINFAQLRKIAKI
jgi:hypothetical protein